MVTPPDWVPGARLEAAVSITRGHLLNEHSPEHNREELRLQPQEGNISLAIQRPHLPMATQTHPYKEGAFEVKIKN